MYTMAQKVLHAVFDDPEGTLKNAAAALGYGIAGVEQSEVLRDKEIIEEQLKKEQGRYETLLDMRMNNEIPKEVFCRKQQEVEKKIAELEQQMMQYGDVKPATEADISGKLENLQRLMEQPAMPEDGEFSEEQPDFFRQFHPFQFAGVYIRLSENRLVFPVAAHNAVHDTVHAGIHELVQCRIFFQSLPSWCRSLPLFWRDSKRKKKKAEKPSCSVRHFLIKYSYGYCHNGRRLVLLRRDCDPPIT